MFILYYLIISYTKLKRYLHRIIKKELLLVFILGISISFFIVNLKNQKYEYLYNDKEELEIIATVISQKQEKEYKVIYEIRVDQIKGKNDKYKGTHLLLNIKNKTKVQDLKYGMQIKICGEYSSPSIARNTKGFSYKNYLKSINIFGNINSEKIQIIKENNINYINTFLNNIKTRIKENINNLLPEKEGNLLVGILTGDTNEIDENIVEDFRLSNLYHMLAVSGAHVSYVILGIGLLLNTLYLNKKIIYIISILALIFFIGVIGYTPSVARAVIMAIILLISNLINRKPDIINSISISMLIILFINPFTIYNVGFCLSYGGTIGIIFFYNILVNSFKNFSNRIREKHLFRWKNIKKEFVEYSNKNKNEIIIYKTNKLKFILLKVKNSIFQMMCVTLSAQVIIMPIMILNFNTLSLTFLVSNLLAGYLIGFITISGFLLCIVSFFSKFISNIISNPLKLILDLLIYISRFCSNLPLTLIYMIKPNLVFISIYYFFLFLIYFNDYLNKRKHLSYVQKKIVDFFSGIQFKMKKHKSRILVFLFILLLVLFIYNSFPKDLKISFIDVGQGDSCLIVTPFNKKILIDGGGSEQNDNYDIGEETLIPYLLGRGINKLDYIIVSHFDSDHVEGLLTVMEKLKVRQVIISKQGKDSDNYQKFKEIVKKKKINVTIVGMTSDSIQRIDIEKNIYFDILWPNNEKFISENVLNNNSIVCKLHYKKISMLFTGDIEEIAEKQILQEYKNNLQLLNSNILKVAHHGSKTSSTQEFIEEVKPKIALIGVGENNKFGHPNDDVIERLVNIGCKIYRTDQIGEITIVVDKNGRIKVKKFIEYEKIID